MDHVAIMKKSWGLIPKIVSGEKAIESRWYQQKRAPWNKITAGDTIFFKNSGEAVSTSATVERVLQFVIDGTQSIVPIIEKYGKKICLLNPDPAQWNKVPKYCILVELKNPQKIKPFHINKKGFGSACAWLTIDNINKIRI